MKEKKRGNCENIEHLNAKFQEILGRNANKTEIRLFPYLIYCLQDNEIEREKLSKDERDLIKEYVSRGLMQKIFKANRLYKRILEFYYRYNL